MEDKSANKQKIKLLLIMDYLRRETDAEHPVTTNALIAYLQGLGISCDRRTLYQDIDLFNEFGFTVKKKQVRHAMGYYLDRERLTAPEMRFLTDAVEAADFLPAPQADKLKDKLGTLASSLGIKPEEDALCFHEKPRTGADVFLNVRLLSRCLTEKKRAGFRYFDLDENRKPVFRKAGRRYFTDPAALVYNEGYYYLVVYSEKYDSLATYRVDRMTEIRLLEEPVSEKALLIRAGVKERLQQTFRMYGGEPCRVKLRFPQGLLGPVYDKFGESVKVKRLGEDEFEAECEVQLSPTFYGWVFQFAGDMRILGSVRAMHGYEKALRRALEGMA